MIQEITFSDKMTIQLVSHNVSDEMVLHAARVSTTGDMGDTISWNDRDNGLLKYLIRENHASTLEHCSLTVFAHVPMFVGTQWMRHRTQSFNAQSGRYSELPPVFYVPNAARPLIQRGKVGHYIFEAGDEPLFLSVVHNLESSYRTDYNAYTRLLEEGVAKEVARMVLPQGMYTSFYATANIRNWLNFLSLRADSHAQHEIRDCATQVESILQLLAPRTLLAWKDCQ